MRDYQSQVVSYTRGRGHLTCTLKGYEPCQDQEQIAEEIGYDSERDLENPTGSYSVPWSRLVVPWYVVEEYMLWKELSFPDSNDAYEDSDNSFAGVRAVQGTAKNSPDHRTANAGRGKYTSMYGSYEEEKELKAIFEKTFGPVSSKKYSNNSRSFGNSESGSSFSGKGGKGGSRFRPSGKNRSRRLEKQQSGHPQRGLSAGGRLQYHICLGGFKRSGTQTFMRHSSG